MNAETLAWIEAQKPDLVEAAETYVTTNRLAEARDPSRGNKAKISGSQLRNLLSVATSERSLAVLVNFLRYQIGRGRQGWDDPPSGQALEALLTENVGARIRRKFGDGYSNRFVLEARLAALLLGYVIRDYTYRCKLEGTSTHD